MLKTGMMTGLMLGTFVSMAEAGAPEGYMDPVPHTLHSATMEPTPVVPAQEYVEPVTYVEPLTYAEPVSYVQPQPVYAAQAPVHAAPNVSSFDAAPQAEGTCGDPALNGHCLVLLHDHMRRVKLPREAGVILVGNPAIADVTVLGKTNLFVSARSTGATNIIVLDKQENEIISYEVYVREHKQKRVTLRHGANAANYQCAPHCERALSHNDSPNNFSSQSSVVQGKLAMNQGAVGTQSGTSPNQEPVSPAIAAGQTLQPPEVPGQQQQASAGPLPNAVVRLAGQ